MEIKEYLLEPRPRDVHGAEKQDDIYLSIAIGNGQIGGSKVLQNGTLIARGSLTQLTYLGKFNDLKNSEIEVETNILDVNSFTNKCVLITTFYNQNKKILFTKIDKGDAPENGVASFKAKYTISLMALLMLFFFNLNNVSAQNISNEVTFKDLETPSSPGFILLDNTPASIERPTTPQGFGVGVLGFFSGTGGAIEVAPFWLGTHPQLTAEKMYRNQFPVLYNFSVSAATVKTDSTNYVAAGFRTRIFQSYSSKNMAKLDSIKGQIEIALADLDMAHIAQLQSSYLDLIAKPVFTVDLAAAIGAGSDTNSFSDLQQNRWAAWLSFNYRPNGNDFYLTALTRYLNNKNFENYADSIDLMDLGARANYDINKFCLSVEYLQRLNLSSTSPNDFRFAAIGSYQLSDQFYITSTFGKNFTDVNNIIALAGINFGFSKMKVKAY